MAQDGFDVGFTYWSAYDERMPWGSDKDALAELTARLEAAGAQYVAVEANLEVPDMAVPNNTAPELTGPLVTADRFSHTRNDDRGPAGGTFGEPPLFLRPGGWGGVP